MTSLKSESVIQYLFHLFGVLLPDVTVLVRGILEGLGAVGALQAAHRLHFCIRIYSLLSSPDNKSLSIQHGPPPLLNARHFYRSPHLRYRVVWSIWSRNTVCWQQIKSSATAKYAFTEAQILLQCQQKHVSDQMDLYSHLHSQLSIFLVIKFNRNPSCPESRALPRADSQVAGEEHVHEVLELVGHLEAEALTHDDVPGRTEPAGTNFDLFNGISYIFVHLK